MRILPSSIVFSGTFLTIVLGASASSIFGNWTGLGGSILDVGQTTDCVCENGNCVTDYRGKTKCICKPRYVIQTEGVCKECYCGEKGKCYFQYQKNTYIKKCLCDAGFADKDGTCTDCQCGENSKCEFEGDDRICYCMDGFAELEGVCTVCNCGEFGECEFENGQKHCNCFENYLVHDGKCKECDCGNGDCSFDGAGNKVCKCDKGFSLKGDRCEACDCGEHSQGCSFDSAGRKVCACQSGFSQKIGECAACQCGTHSTNCQFDTVGTKVCTCENGFAQNGENCEDCSCGEKTIACVFNQGKKACTCADGYTPVNDVCRAKCQDDKDCKNGGSCVGEESKKICKCRKGTSGDNCEIIEGCKEIDPNCHNSGGTCKYDVERESAFCDCPLGKPWNPVLFRCEICQCGTHSTNCLFDSSGIKVCTCENGYAQNDESCEACSCGEKTIACVFNQGRKACTCADGYTPVDDVCRAKCQDDTDCKNGGSCVGEEGKKTCKCRKGTSGDNCEIIEGCKELDPNCHNSGGNCMYDVERESAFCDCPGGKPWNPVLFRCEICQCGAHSTNCLFESSGTKVCTCENGYAQNGESCEACSCGEKTTGCGFNQGRKECTCSKGYTPVNGVCTAKCQDDSNCKNGGSCVGEQGKKVCKCKKGTRGDNCEIIDGCKELDPNCQNSGGNCKYDVERESAFCDCPKGKPWNPILFRCEICQCGTHSTNCLFDSSGIKVCTCENGYAQNGESCEACSCGEKMTGCGFNQGKKVCICADGYTPVNGVCTAKCQDDKDCKNGGSCTGEQGKKVCKCKKGTSGDNCEIIDGCKEIGDNCHNSGGICKYDIERESAFCDCPQGKPWNPALKRCEGCDCGGNSISCTFDLRGQKVCQCSSGFAQRGGTCTACSCGGHTKSCSFSGDTKVCTCIDGYTPINDICTAKCQDDRDCKNGGSCTGEQGKKVCNCKKGTSGDNCEIIDDCKEIGDNCLKSGGICKYDADRESAFCDCPLGKLWNPTFLRCEGCDCGANSVSCAFDSQGQRICQCLSGFSQRGDTCASCSCGENTRTCSFTGDIKVCTCADGYTPINGVCTAQCREDKDCKNGGSCVGEQGKKVCKCKKGTSGDNCEIIDGCKEIEQYCRESGGICKYDVVNEISTCDCPKGLSWNPGLLKCQKCDCGVYSKGCHYNLRGQMICTCQRGYAQWGELCQVCTCGENTKSCHFTPNDKVCTCADGYTLIKGECRSNNIAGCRDDRDCRNGGSCVDEGGIKVCRCKKGTSGDYCEIIDGCSPNCPKTGGICKYDVVHQNAFCDCMPRGMLWNPAMNRCQECKCGANFKACGFDFRGQKVCTCMWGYAQWGDNCVPCSCGDATRTCAFQGGQRVCTCADGYVAINGVCVAACQDDRQCIPGAKCVGDVGHKMCKCRNGLRGRNCEIIIDCERLGPYCHNSGGLCRYDLSREIAYCQCPNGMFWNAALYRCESCYCGPNSKACGFGPQGQKVCYCPWGFAQKGGACVWCNCGPNSVSCSFCSYGRIVCGCRPGFFQRGAYCVGRRGYAKELNES